MSTIKQHFSPVTGKWSACGATKRGCRYAQHQDAPLPEKATKETMFAEAEKRAETNGERAKSFTAQKNKEKAVQRRVAAGSKFNDMTPEEQSDFRDKVDAKQLDDLIKTPSFYAEDDVLDRRAKAHQTSDPEHLTRLSKNRDAITRIAVGANKSTPVAALTRLAVDKNPGVRQAVAKNKNTPESLKKLLREDTDFFVRGAAQ